MNIENSVAPILVVVLALVFFVLLRPWRRNRNPGQLTNQGGYRPTMLGYLYSAAFFAVGLGGFAVHIFAPSTTLGRLLSTREARYAYAGIVVLVFISLARYLMSKGIKFVKDKRNV